MNQRELKVPTWKARRAWERRVIRTLGVRIERKGGRGSLIFLVGLEGGGRRRDSSS